MGSSIRKALSTSSTGLITYSAYLGYKLSKVTKYSYLTQLIAPVSRSTICACRTVFCETPSLHKGLSRDPGGPVLPTIE